MREQSMGATRKDKALLSKSAVARLLGVGGDSVNALIRAGHIETRIIPGQKRAKVTLHSVQRYIEQPPEPATADEFFRQWRNC